MLTVIPFELGYHQRKLKSEEVIWWNILFYVEGVWSIYPN